MRILTAFGLALLPFMLTAIIYWIVKTWEVKGGIGIAVIIFILSFIFFYSIGNAAEPHAIVSFNDAEHLVALTDSVVAICDTVRGYYWNPDCPEDTIWFERKPGAIAWLPGCWNGVKSWTDSIRTSDWQYIPNTITCRELVCVTKTQDRELNHWGQIMIPGRAIIFYEEVKQ